HCIARTAVCWLRLPRPSPVPTAPGVSYRHAATVLDALKKPVGPLAAPVFVFQNQRSAAEGPYDIDQELVMFLKSAGPSGFAITNDEPGLAVPRGGSDSAVVFLIEDGRIQRAPSEFARYIGMPLGAFLEELRLLSPR